MTGRHDCARCDWSPWGDEDPADQAKSHAVDADHPLCVACHRSLTLTERQGCQRCVTLTRRRLDEILNWYACLPDELGHPKSPLLDASRGSRSDETPLTGGDALALLAPGSEGAQWRGKTKASALTSTPWRPVQRVRRDKDGTTIPDEGNDNLHPGDTPSVSYELSRWEDAIRSSRAEPAATTEPTVTGATAYLTARLGWVADYHPLFDDLVAEIRKLHSTVERVIGASTRPERGVPCFDCNADLLRNYGEDDYTCPRCGRIYDRETYRRAVSQTFAVLKWEAANADTA